MPKTKTKPTPKSKPKTSDFTTEQIAARYKKAFKVLFDKLPPETQKKVLKKDYHDKDTQEFARIIAEIAESKGKL